MVAVACAYAQRRRGRPPPGYHWSVAGESSSTSADKGEMPLVAAALSNGLSGSHPISQHYLTPWLGSCASEPMMRPER